MAVVVEQTIPFSSEALDLENSSRWTDLFPLLRPSVKPVRTAKGQTILIDRNLAMGTSVPIAAVGSLGNFSSKLLDDRHVTAIVTDKQGAGLLTSQDIRYAMQSVGAAKLQGIVVVRTGKHRSVKMDGIDIVDVEVASELEQDHVLHLLGNGTGSCRRSIHLVAKLLKDFVKNASTAHSKFHTEKAEGNAAVLHADGTSGFEMARHAVERDLKHAMKAHEGQAADDVYSVHYSDVNGLSRLENYILANEIAHYLDSQNIPYRLSHSTILNHDETARGFSVSICPVDSHYVSAQQRPKPHEASSAKDTVDLQKLHLSLQAHMSFHDAEVRKRIHGGCNAVIKEEATITEYDTIVGDGDCGYTLRDGAKQVLAFIEGKDLTHLPDTVAALVHDLEVNMGGTSGALYCIYLTALAHALATEKTLAEALKAALEQLMKYTNARVGDRTMMDVLIPFVETFAGSGDVKAAIAKAKEGVESTKQMEAKLGRSTYLDESATKGVPDPGAYGLLVLLEGMSDGL